jgi:hypothetical protein
MREKLIALLDLKPAEGCDSVSDEQIIGHITAMKHRDDQASDAAKFERAVTDLVNQSCGAIMREDAKQIVRDRAAEKILRGNHANA